MSSKAQQRLINKSFLPSIQNGAKIRFAEEWPVIMGGTADHVIRAIDCGGPGEGVYQMVLITRRSDIAAYPEVPLRFPMINYMVA